MTNDTTPLHVQLGNAIIASPLSWRKAADAMGISPTSLRRACHDGGASMPVSRVLDIAAVLNVAATEIVPELEDMRVGTDDGRTPAEVLALPLGEAILLAGAAGLSLAELVPELTYEPPLPGERAR